MKKIMVIGRKIGERELVLHMEVHIGKDILQEEMQKNLKRIE
ncbi:hypothetical protein [Fusobacterium polymorphum]|jgi:hypothetical protein